MHFLELVNRGYTGEAVSKDDWDMDHIVVPMMDIIEEFELERGNDDVLLFDGDMEGLRARYAPYRVIRARLAHECAALNLPEAESVTLEGLNAEITFMPAKVEPARLIARLAEACPLADLTVEAPDIERLVADMYEEMAL